MLSKQGTGHGKYALTAAGRGEGILVTHANRKELLFVLYASDGFRIDELITTPQVPFEIKPQACGDLASNSALCPLTFGFLCVCVCVCLWNGIRNVHARTSARRI